MTNETPYLNHFYHQNSDVCCVSQCKANLLGKKVSLHKFPKNEKVRKQWAQVLNMDKVNRQFVCSDHFCRSDYRNTHMRLLVPTAVPSLNLPDKMTRPRKLKKASNNVTGKKLKISNSEDLNQIILIYEEETNEKKPTIVDYIKTDAQLIEFCGIPSIEVFEEILQGVKDMESKKEDNLSLSVVDRVILTFLKITLNLPFVCLSPLFQLSDETCKMYFEETISSLRALLLFTVENYPENGVMLRTLLPINKCYSYNPFDHV